MASNTPVATLNTPAATISLPPPDWNTASVALLSAISSLAAQVSNLDTKFNAQLSAMLSDIRELREERASMRPDFNTSVTTAQSYAPAASVATLQSSAFPISVTTAQSYATAASVASAQSFTLAASFAIAPSTTTATINGHNSKNDYNSYNNTSFNGSSFLANLVVLFLLAQAKPALLSPCSKFSVVLPITLSVPAAPPEYPPPPQPTNVLICHIYVNEYMQGREENGGGEFKENMIPKQE